MSYVEDNLMPGETITYRGHLHWVIYVKPVLFAVIGVALLAFEPALGRELGPVAVLGGVVLVVAAGYALTKWIKARSSEFAVTNKRVIVKVGLIRRDTVELLLSKVESIGVDQTVIGRLFGFGTIIVIGTGGTREPFANIAQPLEFRRHVQARALA